MDQPRSGPTDVSNTRPSRSSYKRIDPSIDSLVHGPSNPAHDLSRHVWGPRDNLGRLGDNRSQPRWRDRGAPLLSRRLDDKAKGPRLTGRVEAAFRRMNGIASEEHQFLRDEGRMTGTGEVVVPKTPPGKGVARSRRLEAGKGRYAAGEPPGAGCQRAREKREDGAAGAPPKRKGAKTHVRPCHSAPKERCASRSMGTWV